MYTLIEHKKLDTAAASITFSNIPQVFTDLVLLLSTRHDRSVGNFSETAIAFNGSSSNRTTRYLGGTGSGLDSGTATNGFFGPSNGSLETANTFSNLSVYMPNYKSSSPKSFSADGVAENNATFAVQYITAGLWNDSSPITSIAITSGFNFQPNTTATLYGINRTQAIGKPKAIGGNITYANGYWVHTFTGSGTFYTQEDLEVDALVVAGGGGASRLGGAGAGGLLVVSPTKVLKGAHPVSVGAGGLGVENSIEYNGTNSSFLGLQSIGGGAGSSTEIDRNGQPGGSGGGAWPVGNGGAGTTGQGNSGGSAPSNNAPFGGGGGGGAGAVGSNQQGGNIGGPGGAGALWNGTYYAGGGAGGDVNGNSILGGIGGGGSSPNNKNGGTNTGGGGGAGGGTLGVGGNGGSGVVIVRYRAD